MPHKRVEAVSELVIDSNLSTLSKSLELSGTLSAILPDISERERAKCVARLVVSVRRLTRKVPHMRTC